MTFTFRPAVRENVPLLIGLAGGTGSGKTYSAMRLAKGLAKGNRFAVIDTENGRASHYADQFDFDVADLRAPFRPDAYSAAIQAADTAGYPVVVVDSMTHEHAGEGGLLDWHEEEFQRLGGRDAVKMTAWIKPMAAHKHMVSQLLQCRAHLILCFRAEEKIEMVKVDGKTEVRPKQTLTGLNGWVPICQKNLPYELTLSVLLMADKPGVPLPIKLQEQHRSLLRLDGPIDERAGEGLAAWSAGGNDSRANEPAPVPPAADTQERIVDFASSAQKRKLDVLVGKLRPAKITTEQLYAALAKTRGVDVEHMTAAVNGRSDHGQLHWAPLRDSLTKTEASDLIERLGQLEAAE